MMDSFGEYDELWTQEQFNQLHIKILERIKAGDSVELVSENTTENLKHMLELSIKYEIYEASHIIHNELKRRGL